MKQGRKQGIKGGNIINRRKQEITMIERKETGEDMINHRETGGKHDQQEENNENLATITPPLVSQWRNIEDQGGNRA